MKKEITTVVFDLGGVLIDWNPRYLYRKLMSEAEADWFVQNIVPGEWNDEMDAGRPFAEAIAERSALYPQHSQLIRAYFDRWDEMISGPIDGTVQILRELHAQGVPLYALSNWSRETFPRAEALYDFLALFQGKVVSGFEKMRKPDPRIFQLLIDRFGLTPNKTLYIDDVEKNIAAAHYAGFVTHHFRSPQQLHQEIEGLGL